MKRRNQLCEDLRLWGREHSTLKKWKGQRSQDQDKLGEFQKHEKPYVAKSRVTHGRVERDGFREGRSRSEKVLQAMQRSLDFFLSVMGNPC